MPKNRNIIDKYYRVCEALRHVPQELDWFKKDFATTNKDLLESRTCKAMNWDWITKTTGFDALDTTSNRWKELKANCFTGNAQEGKGKISGKGKFHNVNTYKKIKSFMYDPADLVFPLWVHGTLEAIIEIKPLYKNDRTQTRPANWILALRNKSMKSLNIHTVQELKEACTGTDRPQMSSPTIMMKDWINDDYTVTLFVDKDELTEHAYTKSILKILKNEGVSL